MEKAIATHSSTLAWKIPWTEEPGRLQSMGSLRVRAQAAGAHCERLGGGTKAQARQSSAPNVLSGVLSSPWGL